MSRRPLRYMGKASLFRITVAGAFFRKLGGFEVARDGTDRKALRDAKVASTVRKVGACRCTGNGAVTAGSDPPSLTRPQLTRRPRRR